MKINTFHISNFGSFSGGLEADTQGFVEYHVSERYEKANMEKLQEWAGSRTKAVRNAATAEIGNRQLNTWRNK